jgi:3-hydroxyacyl-CoA dehydrogenase
MGKYMTASQLENITVLGAGVLGGQIAWHSAFRGKSVVVYDLRAEGIEQCRIAQQTYAHIYRQDLDASEGMIEETRARLTFTTDLAAAVAEADLVIEAVPEIPQVKIDVYGEMAQHLPPHTLIATNSSTLLPSQFAEATGRPDKYCALHFANLIWSLNIGEIMAHPTTADDTLLAVTQFAIEIGMVPIPVEKEQNGYVLNTMLVALLNAAQTLITNGVATPESVDRVHMIMHRGCAMGPCGIIDVVGMATGYNILSYWGNENKDEQMIKNASYIKQRFLDKGLLGLQTGEGYYKYPDPSYQAPDFLDVPDISRAGDLALMAKLT